MTNLVKLEQAGKLLRHLPTLFLAVTIAGIDARAQPSPAETALAGSVSARHDTPWLLRENPGALPFLPSLLMTRCTLPVVAIDGYLDGGILLAGPADSLWSIGGAIDADGVPGYLELRASLAAARRFGELGLGGIITLRGLAIAGYGSERSLSAGLGASARLTDRIGVGASLTGIGGATDGTTGGMALGIGFAFDLRTSTTLSIDLRQELRRSVSFSLGLSDRIAGGIVLRGGIGTAPARIALGVAVETNGAVFEQGAAYLVPAGFRQSFGAGLAW